jgi:hypothetical protein
MIESIVIICFFVLVFIIFFLTYKLYHFSMLILRIEDSVEDCLDLLNESYENVSKILEREVFFDSVEVRQAISEIKSVRSAVLKVAETLTKNMENNNNDDIQDEN